MTETKREEKTCTAVPDKGYERSRLVTKEDVTFDLHVCLPSDIVTSTKHFATKHVLDVYVPLILCHPTVKFSFWKKKKL